MILLSSTNTYRRTEYLTKHIPNLLTNTLFSFKHTLHYYNKHLYNYLLPNNKHYQIPKFYSIPTIYKIFQHLPPFRPIISHCNSHLTQTAWLLDHTLQPLVQSYPDYVHSFITLSLTLQATQLPDKAIVVTIDVNSFYHQTQYMNTIYDEIHNNTH